MKILFSAYACQPNRGSEYGNGWNWPLAIAKLGYEVWVLTSSRGRNAIDQALAETAVENLHFVFVDTPGWIDRRFQGQRKEIIDYLIWQRKAYKIAQYLDQEQRFDLIHHITFGSITAGSWVGRLQKPFIFGPVGGGQVAPSAFKKYFLNDWRKEATRTFIFKRLENINPNSRKTVTQAALVLVTNRDTLEQAQRLGGRRIESFYDTGLPEDYIPSSMPIRHPSPCFRLLWVGRLFARKGLPLSLEALSKVDPRIPLKLTILGGGDFEKYIPQWIDQFSLRDRVEYRGQVPWLEVKNAYLNSDLFFFTSLRDSCPAQLLEAMAFGLPIITLNLHGAGDFVPDQAGIKVPAINPSETTIALAQAIEYLFNNPQERSRMGEVGYEFAKTQTWSCKAAKMSEYYQQLTYKNRSDQNNFAQNFD